ncbi:FG-GAP repeat protein [Bradyrhizobium lablabi]|uniref:FG-GAP-like repeat-containing protein n=1 Tax=Bradyrhizobium lablabi TaxID=722472 RepID=UPI001BA4D01B|nr:FG-GAP-like repeat-containing protein [Bradyrhizobium lablabi]MBR1123495.1 FG-GAP repeat protein [Bradyrhizobium lablabi]
MAITITANNFNADSTGIDVSAYLATFVSPNYSPAGFGYFSSDPSDFSGNQYAVTEQTNLLPDPSKQAIVFESGGGGNSIDYDFATHVVGGDLDAISFGYGLTYTSGTDSFPLSQLDLRISGLGLVNQTGADSTVSELLNDGRIGSITHLSSLLAANAINFVGSTGADAFTGYAFNDTVTGGGGNDTFNGGGGTNTAVYSGNRADYTVTDNGGGNWTITDNRGGSPDGVDTLTSFRFAQFADQTVSLTTVAPVAANDSATAGKNIRATINVLANDTDSDGTIDPTTVAVGTGPAHGSVSVNATTGVITYTPTVGYVGADSFTYTVKDNDGLISNEVTVNINVAAKLTLTSADEAFVADAVAVGPVEVDGGAGADYLSGSSNPMTAGADSFYGGEGNDVIFGAGGNDYIEGNAGDDILRSGSGNDTLIGGAGTDTYGIRIFANTVSGTLDTGTVTIIDNDGVLWNGAPRPATIPAGWTSTPPANAGYQIHGTATAVSAGVWDLAVVDDSGATKHFALGWSPGGDLTLTAGNEVVTIKDYVNGTFGITLEGVPVGGVPHDFNGDGKSDIVWRNDAGVGQIWDMDGATILDANSLGGVPTNWNVAGTGDFNGDGKADLLWRNDAGVTQIWNMDDGAIASTRSLGVIPTNWNVLGAGDFNGDGQADLLWRNDNGTVQMWDMNDGAIVGAHNLGVIPAAWKLAGTGDFNGDGNTDLLWRNDNGVAQIWDMDGGNILSATSLGSIPTNWQVAGVGDFNGDSKSDILWRNDSGVTQIWNMNNATIDSTRGLGVIPTTWEVGAIGDYNGDHMSDIVWRNDSGVTQMWEMNDGAITQATSLGVIPDNWHIIA